MTTTEEKLSLFVARHVECIDLGRSKHPISTGIGFLDHMIDQLNSHAQIGVAISLDTTATENDSKSSSNNKFMETNRFAKMNQSELMSFCGTRLGQEMANRLLKDIPLGRTSRFCCPLDEALVECKLTCALANEGRLSKFTLSPYGIYPRSTGRLQIGQMKTKPVEDFFRAFATSAGLDISLSKIRGHNGHHIVESAFKAFSRALRNLLDGTTIDHHHEENENDDDLQKEQKQAFQRLWGKDTSSSWNQSVQANRTGKVERQTKETSISVQVKLNNNNNDDIRAETGISILDTFFTLLAREANCSLDLSCRGDLWIDDHHTSEDVSIALGQVLHKALGTKAGLNRMWCSNARYRDALVEVTMDLSNRPCLTSNLTLDQDEYILIESTNNNNNDDNNNKGEEEKKVGNDDEQEEEEVFLTTEMLQHVLESLVMNSHTTVHVVEHEKGSHVSHRVLATAMAFGRALGMCAAVDPRRAGKTASSKGTLSV